MQFLNGARKASDHKLVVATALKISAKLLIVSLTVFFSILLQN